MKVNRSEIKTKQKNLRHSAKDRGIAFSLSVKDLERLYETSNTCCYFGTPLVEGKISIDRIDSKKGYIVGNIVLCSTKANNLKNQLFENEVTKISKDELSHFINVLL